MEYTVKKLAKISGISIRTLHWYDQIGLLKPAYHSANGYRHYEQKQLLRLQQILFFKELGFELKQIQKIIERSDFDQMVALSSHREVLKKKVKRTEELIKTVDQTINHLKGKIKMKEEDIYKGFDEKKQQEYEKQLIERFGEKVKETFAECEKNTKNWTKSDWNKTQKDFEEICRKLADLLDGQFSPGSFEVQNIIRSHHSWLKRFWNPTKEKYAGHADLILETDLRKAYEAHHSKLPEFLAKGIKIFAEKEL